MPERTTPITEAPATHADAQATRDKQKRTPRIFHHRQDLAQMLENLFRQELADVDLPVSLIDVLYHPDGEKNNGVTGGQNYEALRTLVDQEGAEGRSIILADWRPFRDLARDPRIYGLLANKRSAFIRYPFGAAEIQELCARLQALPPLHDEVAARVAELATKSSLIGPLKHALEQGKLGSAQAADAVRQVNERFSSTFDPETEQRAAREFLEQFETEKETAFAGQPLSGVYCDMEGTLIDTRSGAVNQEVLDKLNEYDRTTFVHLWTGGDVDTLRNHVSRLGKTWMVMSKYDFAEAQPEIVIDDLAQRDFEAQYRIRPQSYRQIGKS